ncbi:MAG: hypothetical protein K2H01_01440 [Ruminococcus sp.]|nr:hypothetical protein [Ruminococcus sp.]
MSDFIDSHDEQIASRRGMLFLFDVVNSSERASKSEDIANSIFYQKISIIVKNVADELNKKYRYGVQIEQNTGDGCYIFSEEPECCLELWILLHRQFANELLIIRCGAAYGKVHITKQNIGSHLANIVSRCCGFSNNENNLIITTELYNLIKDSSLFHTVAPNISRIDNPNLKGCVNVDTIYQLSLSSEKVESESTKCKTINFYTQTMFVGRNEVLQDCINATKATFSKNEVLNIVGISGVGKTTIAMCVAKLLDYDAICIDLRLITNLRELHGLLVNLLFNKLNEENLAKEVVYEGSKTLTNIFSGLSKIALVFDHSELLLGEPYKEIVYFLPNINKLRTNIILTSTQSQSINAIHITEWRLFNPSNDEKVEMLSHWIKTKRAWLVSFASQITNHSYLICLIGYQYKGNYRRKKDLVSIANQIIGAENVSNYLSKIINELSIDVRFWVYLAYLCNGSVFSNAIPKSVIEIYNDRGLIKEIGESTFFHPLVMRAVESEHQGAELGNIVYDQLCNVTDEKSMTLVAYYKYLCLDESKYNEKSEILIDNWQAWSEEIDSYKTQALIEKLKISLGIFRKEELYDLYSSIIHIFQGRKDDLVIAQRKCEELFDCPMLPLVVRLLAKIESIECQRKLYGPNYSIELIYNHLYILNNMLCSAISDDYVFYGKYYYLGTFFFLIGNILRSMEDHNNAIIAYNISLQYINKEGSKLRNAELQKVHIAYGIAESYLKVGQSVLAIELANESIRTAKTNAKFGLALLHLLKARAYLCLTFPKTQNYKEALKSVKKAEKLFESIRLPNYIQRCNFVEAAIYTKKRNMTSAQKTFVKLREHLSGTDDMTYRVNIFLNYIIGIKGITSISDINAITKRKGKQIGLFYQKLSKMENSMPISTITNTIKIDNDQLVRDTFSINISDFDETLWLVD